MRATLIKFNTNKETLIMSHSLASNIHHEQRPIKDAVVRARVSADLKDNVENVLSRLGMTMTEAIILYLSQIKLKGGIPFDIKLPNKETAQAIKNAREGKNLVYCKDVDDMFKKMGVKCSSRSTKKSSKET